MRKLFKTEHPFYGTYFFTNASKVAHAIDSSYIYVHTCLKKGRNKIKGFDITEIEDDGNIISQYLDANVIFINGKTLRY
jgi:hypothetical protein